MKRASRLAVAAAFAVVLVAGLAFGATRHVDGEAMVPALSPGETVLIDRLVYRFRMPYRGDIVACRDDQGSTDVLRVAGIGGDVVEIDGVTASINGTALPGSSGAAGNVRLPRGRWLVPGGMVFLLGDNRATARDSRHFGVVPIRRLQGRVFYRVTPFRYRGWL